MSLKHRALFPWAALAVLAGLSLVSFNLLQSPAVGETGDEGESQTAAESDAEMEADLTELSDQYIPRVAEDESYTPSAAYQWMDILLEASAQDVDRIRARPTILSRQMAIVATGMYDAWACYDDVAVGTRYGGSMRRPEAERTQENKETAIAYAAYRTMMDQLPYQAEYIESEMKRMGYDPMDDSMDPNSPVGIGNLVAKAILEYRHDDGANQLGNEIGGMEGKPFSDYTMYRPVNTPEMVYDPNRWQPLPFTKENGEVFYPGFLTPQWYRVKCLALESSDQFRAPAPPTVDTEQLKAEVDECIEMNANLAVEEKALVEFMRDGPRSTAQSGHWLRFAQAVSKRDSYDLDMDIKLYFTVGNTAMDAFIACWDSKRYYDTSRPWTLVRYYYAGETIRGWAGPGKGVKEIPAEEWHPYSPSSFITPPFPGYVSGHSTVSSACAKALELFTGSDIYQAEQAHQAGSLTEANFECEVIQQVDGIISGAEGMSCGVVLQFPTFSKTAEMAGISRVMGGYHVQCDNIEALEMGRKISEFSWPVYQSYFDGTAEIRD